MGSGNPTGKPPLYRSSCLYLTGRLLSCGRDSVPWYRNPPLTCAPERQRSGCAQSPLAPSFRYSVARPFAHPKPTRASLFFFFCLGARPGFLPPFPKVGYADGSRRQAINRTGGDDPVISEHENARQLIFEELQEGSQRNFLAEADLRFQI